MTKFLLILLLSGVASGLLIGSSSQSWAQFAGVPIEKIDDGSVYQKMGLKVGDVIKSINSTPVSSRKDIDDAFSKIESGGKIRLDVMRDGKAQIFHMRAPKSK